MARSPDNGRNSCTAILYHVYCQGYDNYYLLLKRADGSLIPQQQKCGFIKKKKKKKDNIQSNSSSFLYLKKKKKKKKKVEEKKSYKVPLFHLRKEKPDNLFAAVLEDGSRWPKVLEADLGVWEHHFKGAAPR